MIKPIYTVSCVNESNNIDDVYAASTIFLRTKYTPQQIEQKDIDETVFSFINGLKKDQLLYVINAEICNIL